MPASVSERADHELAIANDMKEIVNMSEKEAYEVIRKILCGQDEKQELPYLEPDSHIKKDLGLDSFQLVEMIGELEDKLDIYIPDRE